MYTIRKEVASMADGNDDTLETPDDGRTPAHRIDVLRRAIARLQNGRRQSGSECLSSGCEGLDGLLPDRGFRYGTLVEWLVSSDGSGGETLALIAARHACRQGGSLVVLDESREFYPPAAVCLGIALDKLIVVQAANAADNLWALDQILRCPGVAAALAWPAKLDGRTFRRLQLAAEQGGGLGLLIRPENVRHEPSWADVRLLVEPLPMATSPLCSGRRLRIELLHGRGGASGRSVEVRIDDETHPVHLAPQLADSASCSRSTGA